MRLRERPQDKMRGQGMTGETIVRWKWQWTIREFRGQLER
jgi:hypothetical protein